MNYVTFAICGRNSVCLSSVTLVRPTQPVEIFGNFFHYTIAQGLVFWCQKSLVGDAPFPLKFALKVTYPLLAQRFRPISAHSASTVIANEKSSISTYRKSTTRFPTSHRWTVYVTPKSPKRVAQKRDIAVCASKIQLLSKNVCYKVSLYEYFQRQSCSYIIPLSNGHRSIAGDVPIYLKFAFKVTHPFRKRRFPKLSFKGAIGLGAFWSSFSPYDTLAIHWHPQKMLRRSSQGNP